MISSIATYLPLWGTAWARIIGDDEDTVTMAVAAGRLALTDFDVTSVDTVVLITKEFPLMHGGNAAVLLAGLGLANTVRVREQLGGSPASLDAVADAEPGTLVIGVDAVGPCGAAAVLCGASGASFVAESRVNRSMPVATRDMRGIVTDYADPRLLRVRGVGASLLEAAAIEDAAAGLAGESELFAAVAGMAAKDAASLSEAGSPALTTVGPSASLFALAALIESGRRGRVLAVDQAVVSTGTLGDGAARVLRHEPTSRASPKGMKTEGAPISISLSAYERAFEAKLRLEADKCRTCALLAYPHRHRCLGCGAEGQTDSYALPRRAVVYSLSTIHTPVPGLTSPYTVILAQLGDSGVRLLVRLTGAEPGSVKIDDAGELVFRLVAIRSGVPDYGYAFLPDVSTAETAPATQAAA